MFTVLSCSPDFHNLTSNSNWNHKGKASLHKTREQHMLRLFSLLNDKLKWATKKGEKLLETGNMFHCSWSNQVSQECTGLVNNIFYEQIPLTQVGLTMNIKSVALGSDRGRRARQGIKCLIAHVVIPRIFWETRQKRWPASWHSPHPAAATFFFYATHHCLRRLLKKQEIIRVGCQEINTLYAEQSKTLFQIGKPLLLKTIHLPSKRYNNRNLTHPRTSINWKRY